MQIHGLEKMTLLDYPGKVACTVFLGKCNFCCPFCQNGQLVLRSEEAFVIPEEEVFSFLEKRRGLLDGVCITGGEPTLEPELEQFIRKVRDMGYAVKLDTNGYRPEILKRLLEKGLLDYVAMDIKNAPQSYEGTAGIPKLRFERIEESVELLRKSGTDYEFRTTVVKELHSEADFQSIAKWLAGCKRYFIQNFRMSEDVIMSGLHGFSQEELEAIRAIMKESIDSVEIR